MTTNTEKTIRMPATTLEKWLAALRSGKYQQTENYLEANGKYCCLGVLQMVVDGTVEKCTQLSEMDRFGCNLGQPLGLPTSAWLAKNGIQSRYESSDEWEDDSENLSIPYSRYDDSVAEPTGASELNDNEHLSFKEIADLVEACTETY